MAENSIKTEEHDYVLVSLDEESERIELPTEQDHTLRLQTLIGAFPGAHGLKYKNPSTGAYRALLMNETGTKFHPPRDTEGWSNKVFIVLLPASTAQEINQIKKEKLAERFRKLDVGGKEFEVSKRSLKREPDSLLARIADNDDQQLFEGNDRLFYDKDVGKWKIDRDPEYFPYIQKYLRTGQFYDVHQHHDFQVLMDEAQYYGLEGLVDICKHKLAMDTQVTKNVLNSWDSRVFRIHGQKLEGTCVLIDHRRVLTAAHLSFKIDEFYKIKGVQVFNVKCIFICKNYDFAILQSDDLPDKELSIGSLARGYKYYIMGYPDGVDPSKPTFTKGIIEGFMNDGVQLVGTPGSARGYSGAPVFNDSARLAGLLLGGTSKLTPNTTIQECMDSSAEQKYARILGIGTIKAFYSFKGYSDSES